MSFQIMTHTPEQEEKWKHLASSNPGRVVRAMRLSPRNSRTKEGDSMADIFPIVAVLHDMTTRTLDPAWPGLVKAGVINALCMGVKQMTAGFAILPGMPADVFQRAKESITSVYMQPLEVLVNVMLLLSNPPTKSEMDSIKTIIKHWTEMMERVWEEPENTLLPGDLHDMERCAVAIMVQKLLVNNPSEFLAKVYSNSDMTIQVLSRFWAQTVDVKGTISCGGVLTMLLDPKERKHIEYSRTNPPPVALILDRILDGVAPRPSASRAVKATALIDIAEKHMQYLSGLDVDGVLLFMREIVTAEDSDVIKALISSTSFWKAFSDLFRRLHANTYPDSRGRRQDHIAMPKAIDLATAAMFAAEKQSSRDGLSLLSTWMKSSVLDAIDDTMESLLLEDDIMPFRLFRLFRPISVLIPQADPATATLFVSQFPLSHSVSLLLPRDKQQAEEGPVVRAHEPGPPPNSAQWTQMCCRLIASLQYRARSPDHCERRGCPNLGKKKCSNCKEIGYCSSKCQKQDWNNHKILCGFKGIEDARRDVEKLKGAVVQA